MLVFLEAHNLCIDTGVGDMKGYIYIDAGVEDTKGYTFTSL